MTRPCDARDGMCIRKRKPPGTVCSVYDLRRVSEPLRQPEDNHAAIADDALDRAMPIGRPYRQVEQGRGPKRSIRVRRHRLVLVARPDHVLVQISGRTHHACLYADTVGGRRRSVLVVERAPTGERNDTKGNSRPGRAIDRTIARRRGEWSASARSQRRGATRTTPQRYCKRRRRRRRDTSVSCATPRHRFAPRPRWASLSHHFGHAATTRARRDRRTRRRRVRPLP